MRARFLVPKVLAVTLVACSDSVEVVEQNDAGAADAATDAATDGPSCECTKDMDCPEGGICIECFCAFA